MTFLRPPADLLTSALTVVTWFSLCFDFLDIDLTLDLTGIFYALIFSLTAFELLALH